MYAKRFWQGATSLLLLVALAACGGESTDGELGVFTGAPERSAGGGGGGAGGLVVNSADAATLAYAETELTATTGTLNVTFNNKGVIPHNWTLVPQGQEDAAVAESASSAPDYTYAPALGQSKMLNAGESDVFTANITEPGTYTYLCTFPGHYVSGMKGTLIVTAGGEEGGSEGGAPAGGGAPVTVDSADAATLAYAQTTLEANAGALSVTFNNKGVVPHNWTLVPEGEEDAAVSGSATDAPNYTYAPALAQTKMLNTGESDTVNVTLEPGTYTYLCTFPGHYISGMKGTLVVK